MLAYLLVKPFGSIWNIREKCNHKVKLISKLSKLLYSIYNYENCSSISWKASFKNEPNFPHGIRGVFVSSGAIIGSNCVIFQQVTIGSNTLPDAKFPGAPTIGNNVYIGAGAKIIGAIKIGDNVRIGANTVVYKNVPDNSVVVSGKQRIILKEAPLDNKYYSYNSTINI